jgi:hypothetical protein
MTGGVVLEGGAPTGTGAAFNDRTSYATATGSIRDAPTSFTAEIGSAGDAAAAIMTRAAEIAVGKYSRRTVQTGYWPGLTNEPLRGSATQSDGAEPETYSGRTLLNPRPAGRTLLNPRPAGRELIIEEHLDAGAGPIGQLGGGKRSSAD